MTTLTPREIFAQKQALTALPLNWFELDEWFPPLLFEGRQVVKKLKAADIDAYIRLRSVLRGAISPDVMRRNREIRCEAIVSLLRDEEARIVSGFATPPEITSTSGGSGRATGSSATRVSGISLSDNGQKKRKVSDSVARNSLEISISEAVRHAAGYYLSPHERPTHTDAAFYWEGIETVPVASLSTNDFLIIPAGPVTHRQFSASDLLVSGALAYRIIRISKNGPQTTLTLAYTMTYEPGDVDSIDNVEVQFVNTSAASVLRAVDVLLKDLQTQGGGGLQDTTTVVRGDADTTGESRFVFDELDGKQIEYRDKQTKLSAKLILRRCAFRFTNAKLWRQLVGDLVTWDPQSCWDELHSMATKWVHLRGHELRQALEMGTDETALAASIADLPCMQDASVYTSFFRGEFGRHTVSLPVGSRGLQAFLPSSAHIYDKSGKQLAVVSKNNLRQSLNNFETWLRYVGGKEYEGVTTLIIKRIHNVADMGDEIWHPGYIRYKIEQVVYLLLCDLKKGHHDVYKGHRIAEMRECDITVASGVSKALPLLWAHIELLDADQQYWERTIRPPPTEVPFSTSSPMLSPGVKRKDYTPPVLPDVKRIAGGAEAASITQSQAKHGCIRYLKGELGMKDKEGKRFQCTHGDRCQFMHVPRGSTKSAFVDSVRSIDDKFLPDDMKTHMITEFSKRA